MRTDTGAGASAASGRREVGVFGAAASYLFSAGVPLLLGLVLVPPVFDALGAGDFSLLTLYWMMLTFLGNFDFGVGQTITKLLAAEGRGPLRQEESQLASAGFIVQALTGLLLAGACIAALSLLDPSQRRSIWEHHAAAFGLVLLTFPVLSISAGLRAALEARKDFHFVSASTLLAGTAQFAIPWILVRMGAGIDAIVLALALARIAIGGLLAGRLALAFGYSLDWRRGHGKEVRAVVHAGSWIGISSVVNLLLFYIDRLILPFHFPLQALASYILPLDFLQRLMIAPAALNRVSYPYLLQAGAEGEQLRRRTYSRMALAMSAWGMFMLLAALIAPQFLSLWLGAEFARSSGTITQIIMVALSFGGLAYLATNMLIAAQRTAIDPRVQMAIAPFFILALLWAMQQHSLDLVALVVLARVVVHCVILLLAMRHWIPHTRFMVMAQLLGHTCGAALVLFACL